MPMILLLLALQLSSTEVPALSVVDKPIVASAPQIMCDIRLRSWCITTFDGSINMVDDGATRTWTLRERLHAGDKPFIIVEDKNCNIQDGEAHELVASPGVINGENYSIYKLELNSIDRCGLEFRYTQNYDRDYSYQQLMKYGILVCEKGACNLPIASFYGKNN